MGSKRLRNIIGKLLSDNFYILKKITFDYQLNNGKWVTQSREVYNRGDGAGILLYNKKKETVILTKQFRMPTYMNGNKDGLMVEVCAGMLDEDDPITCIIRETEEETGFKISHVEKVFEAFTSPGVMTEKMYFFIGEYTDAMKLNAGGGLESEHEDIEVLEIPFEEAVKMLKNGVIIDARTIILLQYAIINNLFNE